MENLSAPDTMDLTRRRQLLGLTAASFFGSYSYFFFLIVSASLSDSV